MKSTKTVLAHLMVLLLVLAAGCGGGSGGGSPAPAPTLVSIAVTPANSTVAADTVLQFVATGTFSDNTTQDVTATTGWGCSDIAVATVSDAPGSKGVATAMAGGTATITATTGTISGSTKLTVTGPTLVSITVTPANPTIATGSVQQFIATGNYSDNSKQDLTAIASWSSSANSIAAVSDAATSKGVSSAVAAGTTTITATVGTFTDSSVLTVTGPTLVSITVTPANSTTAPGTVLQFVAQGNFSDNTTQVLTSNASWSSSDSTVASVSDAAGSKGTAMAVAAGTATITARLGTVSGSTSLTVAGSGALAPNAMSVTVNGSLCSDATSVGYFNKPCVSVTVCNPGTSTCQTVNDILLDTGSYGLRIFKSAIPGLTLPQVTIGSGSLAECIQFADGSAVWGPVQRASVQLGNEPAVQVPIQVIDASFGTRPTSCTSADPDPATAGFTGILGVGVLTEDCGSGCVNSSRNGIYYSCTGLGCSGTAVSIANQVKNPAAQLPQDNNGFLLQFPSVPPGGVSSTTGSLIFGIGTQTNNTAFSPTVFPTDSRGEFRTVYSGINSQSFLDTGSNAYYIPNLNQSVLPPCSAPNSAWYCPPSTRTLLATTVGATGQPSLPVQFTVGNFLAIVNSPNNVFSETAGTSTFGFDWGLPFFMGRNVFFGFERKAGLGSTGPYVAY
jgi:hypothetical protein